MQTLNIASTPKGRYMKRCFDHVKVRFARAPFRWADLPEAEQEYIAIVERKMTGVSNISAQQQARIEIIAELHRGGIFASVDGERYRLTEEGADSAMKLA